MIFITVGTHEQGMDRLLIELDRLIKENIISDEIIAQIGYSKYLPKNYKYKKIISYDEMDKYLSLSNIIITHGGPGSIFSALSKGKIPIVVPRNPAFNEHVDNHQILFTKRLEKESKVLAVYDIKELSEKINKYDLLFRKCKIDKGGSDDFINKFSFEINKIMKDK